jgi:DNA-binding phage protein
MIILRSVRDVTRLVQMEVSYRWSITDVAAKADVCRDTVKRLAEGETKSPHFRTVIKILKAMGYKVKVGGDRGTRMPTAFAKTAKA